MYAYIIGTVAEKAENSVVLETNGIGYELFVSRNTAEGCTVGETQKLHTYLNVKEDEMSLFGFADRAEKGLFLHLISISGVGPKLALAILGGMKLRDLIVNIVSGNATALDSIKGVGKKTAERIIVELKDKLDKDYDGSVQPQEEEVVLGGVAEEAATVLVALGYKKDAASKAISAVYREGLTVNQLVHKALGG